MRMMHYGSGFRARAGLKRRLKTTLSYKRHILGTLLKNVSRSFYLTLRVLPEELRDSISLAYLLARAADTIADTQIIPSSKRLDLLLALRSQINGNWDAVELSRIETALAEHQENPHERILLKSLLPALQMLAEFDDHDQAEVKNVVTTLTTGMELDLRTFPLENSGQLVALRTLSDLDRYTYLVAGCVGDFWTRMTVAHTPALQNWDLAEMSPCGIRFGKALQMTNVMRDCAKDLRIGRCYLPRELLSQFSLLPEELLNPDNSVKAQVVLFELLKFTLEHYREAKHFLLAIPSSCGRLRLACLWPILIGLETLKELAQNTHWLDPAHPSKISRWRVYQDIALSLPSVGSDTLVNAWIDCRITKIEQYM